MTTTEAKKIIVEMDEYDLKRYLEAVETVKNLAQIYTPVFTVTDHRETRWAIALSIKKEVESIGAFFEGVKRAEELGVLRAQQAERDEQLKAIEARLTADEKKDIEEDV